MSPRRKPARKPYEGAGRQPLWPDSRKPPAITIRLGPEDAAALEACEEALGGQAVAIRALLRAHAESPAVRSAVAAWRAVRAR